MLLVYFLFQVINARKNQLKNSGIPNGVFSLEELLTVVSFYFGVTASVYNSFVMYLKTYLITSSQVLYILGYLTEQNVEGFLSGSEI
jgi:hypothetical protein